MRKTKLLESLPEPWPEDLRPQIHEAVIKSGLKVVVMDDDPTGTQTVHGVPVLTHWSHDVLCRELENDLPAFYLLTNSRSVHLFQARRIASDIGRRLKSAAQETGRGFAVVSRSDSTLRGHFPGEVDALAATLDYSVDGWILCPFFEEGGRYTIGDIHFVQEEGILVPAGETLFARDPAFGYRSSNLREWVEEKSAGRIRAADTHSISIRDLRQGGPRRVQEVLSSVCNGSVCVVNAATYRDLEVFMLGLLSAEANGKRFLYRTAASFVQVRAGLWPMPLLTGSDLGMTGSGGGLSIVGSFVQRTSEQVAGLVSARPDIVTLEVDVRQLVDEASRYSLIGCTADLADKALSQGFHVMIFTSREYLSPPSKGAGLAAGQVVSQGLVSILDRIQTRPRYILAKGGITSSDIATQALGIKRAMVLGQLVPGVPVWKPDSESRFPGVPFVVFPGNVGDRKALLRVLEKLE